MHAHVKPKITGHETIIGLLSKVTTLLGNQTMGGHSIHIAAPTEYQVMITVTIVGEHGAIPVSEERTYTMRLPESVNTLSDFVAVTELLEYALKQSHVPEEIILMYGDWRATYLQMVEEFIIKQYLAKQDKSPQPIRPSLKA